MKARIEKYQAGQNQKLLLSLDGNFKEQYERFKNSDVEVTIKKWSPKHSPEQMRYAWKLADMIAARMHIMKSEVYKNTLKDIPGVTDIHCVKNEAVNKFKEIWESNGLGWQVDLMPSKLEGCTNIVCYYGMSTFTKQQMSEYIEALIYQCKELGLDWETPESKAVLESIRKELENG